MLITGATGALGPSVAWALCREGFDLRILALDKPEEGILPDKIDIRIGDVTDKKVVNEALIGVNSVIYIAALLHINNPKFLLPSKSLLRFIRYEMLCLSLARVL